MRLLTRLSVLAALVTLAFPAGALAQIRTLVFTSAPISIGRYAVAQGGQLAASPQVDGSVVGMSADVVDMLGNPVPPTDVNLPPR